MDTLHFLLATLLAFTGLAQAQQYLGDFINNSLPLVPNTEITYFRIPDPAGKNNNLTLINYYSHDSNGNRLTESKIQRAVIVIHGLNRDPGTYESNALSALYQLNDPNINFDTVAVIAPYFANGDDKNVGYPWTAGLPAGQGSTTNALVWPGSQWSAGGNAQYPLASAKTISSFYVLDTLVKYFDNQTLFPNVKQIVVAGHSLGAQTVHRYALIGNQLNTKSPVTYWVANPNSYTWPATTRPFDTSSCPTYDNYRDGFNNFTQYPMTYATSLVSQGRPAIVSNYFNKSIAYARGLQDLGDDSSNCAPFTSGSNRNERFFNFIKTFPPTCPDPKARNCDTIDLINVGHDSGQMMASPAGQRRLFLDNFKGDGSRGVDMGYPRVQAGDDPYPDPTLNATLATYNNNTYAGNMTYYGCYSDQQPATLLTLAYDNSNNTIELCTATCNAMGYSIAGVEYASQCYCGNALTSKAQRTVESSCGFTCAGNSNETCGGFGRISIFSRGKPAQLSPPVAPETVGPYYYQNCLLEVPGRALQGDATYSTNNMTLEMCASFCSSYRYFGTEYAQECYCGNSIVSGANATNNNECNMVCSGNPLELCGAGNRITLYGLPPGVNPSSVSSAAPAAPTGSAITCPQSNNTIYSTNGQNFLIECGIDHLGGDLSSVNVNSLSQCIDTCATTAGCVDISLSGAACYMKSSVLDGQPNAGIYGARFVNNTVVSSTVTSKSSTVLSSSSSSTSSSVAVTSSSTSSIPPSSSFSVVISSSSTSVSSSSSVPSPSSMASTSSSAVVFSSSTPIISSSSSAAVSSTISSTSSSSGIVSSTTSSTSSSSAIVSSTISSTSSSIIASSTSSSSVIVSSTTSSTSSSAPPVITSSSTITTVVTSSSSASAAASATPVSCPASNNTVFTAFNGARFLIECGINHYAGDLSMSYVSDFNACINNCANTTSCVDVTMNGYACYLKSTLGAAQSQGGVLGAKLLPPATPSVSSSSKPTTSTLYTSVSGYAYPTLAPGFQYNGCFQDGGARIFPLFNGSSSTNTPQQCANNCRVLGYRYSGTEYASECYCANYFQATQVPDTQCAKPCSGDATQDCGDGYRLSVVIDNNWVQTLFARQSYNTWNLAGCYVDNANGRDLPNPVAIPGGPNNATTANCLSACQAQGYTYCGSEYYKECYGANAIGATNTPLAGSDIIAAGCNTPCAGNATEVCGGVGKIAIYVNNGTST